MNQKISRPEIETQKRIISYSLMSLDINLMVIGVKETIIQI